MALPRRFEQDLQLNIPERYQWTKRVATELKGSTLKANHSFTLTREEVQTLLGKPLELGTTQWGKVELSTETIVRQHARPE